MPSGQRLASAISREPRRPDDPGPDGARPTATDPGAKAPAHSDGAGRRDAALDGRRTVDQVAGGGAPRRSAVRQTIGLVTLVVRDYDEAIAYFTQMLGFALVQDTPLAAGKRWVVVAPRGGATGLLLARAADERQRQAIGAQAGGRVFLFLYTDDFARDHAAFAAQGVTFVEAPRREPYGTLAVFTDLYGNRWDLIEPAGPGGGAPV
jgi:catechol 2,3-dioxygenase-like lactoylglutathione lyase family enzyme